MNGFLVTVWGDDIIPVRLFATREEAKELGNELWRHYGFTDDDPAWRGSPDEHHPDVIAAGRTAMGEVGFTMHNYSITEFRDGRPV